MANTTPDVNAQESVLAAQLKDATLAQSIAVQAGLALQDQVAAARDFATIRQAALSNVIGKMKDMDPLQQVQLLKELQGVYNFSDSIQKMLQTADALKATTK